MKSFFIFLLFIMPLSFYVEVKCMNGISDNQCFDSLKAKAQLFINTSDEILYLDSLLSLSKTEKSTYWECKTMSYLVRNYYNRMVPDSLNFWADKVLDLALKNQYYSIYFDVSSLVCLWEIYDKNYDIALEKANNLYMLAKDVENENGMIASYEVLGMIYMETFRYVEAIKSFQEGLELQKKQQIPRYAFQFQFISYIIESYLKLKDFDNVRNFLSNAYGLIEKCKQEEINFPINRCLWLLNCYNIEMYVSLNMPQKAEKYIIESNKFLNVDDFYVFCYFHLSVASYFRLIGNYTKALENVDLVLSQADDYLPALKIKAELLLYAGREKESASLYHHSLELIDSTYNESLSKQINQLRTIHEVDKLELKNKHAELKVKNYKLRTTYILIIILILFFLLFKRNYYRLKKTKELLERSEENLIKEKEELIISRQALIQAKQNVENLSNLKEVFLANFSHEIRTPLNSIVGFSSMLCDMLNQPETKEYVSVVKHNSDLLLKIVDNVVTISLLQTNGISTNIDRIELKQFCETILKEYESQISPMVKMELVALFDEYVLSTDAILLKLLLENLLSNAVKFTNEGNITFVCKIDNESHLIYFIIEDTGIGIPEERRDKIFESFEKENSFSQGLGLGLAICKFVANKLNGAIELDSTYKKGTRMIFTHPINI